MSPRYDNIKRQKPQDTQLGILRISTFLGKIQQRASGPKESAGGLWEHTEKGSDSRVELDHSNHIVNVGIKATCLHFNPWSILKEESELASPFGTMPQEPRLPGKCAKLDHVIQLNCRELCTHRSYKITRAWENFNNRGTKVIFLWEELWLISSNCKSFGNGSNSIARNNLGLCEHPNAGVYPVNIAKFLRTAFYIEHLWWLLLDSNLILATQILTKTKKKLFLYFHISHTNQTNTSKKMCFSCTVNINENFKKIDEK